MSAILLMKNVGKCPCVIVEGSNLEAKWSSEDQRVNFYNRGAKWSVVWVLVFDPFNLA